MKRNKMDLKSLTSLSKNQMLKIIGGSDGGTGSTCGVLRECGVNNACPSDDCECKLNGTTSYCWCKKGIISCS